MFFMWLFLVLFNGFAAFINYEAYTVNHHSYNLFFCGLSVASTWFVLIMFPRD